MNSKTNLFYLERCVETLKHLIVNRNLFLAPRGLVINYSLFQHNFKSF